MIAEAKLLAMRKGCDIDKNDRSSKMLEEFFFLGRNGLCGGGNEADLQNKVWIICKLFASSGCRNDFAKGWVLDCIARAQPFRILNDKGNA